MKIRKFGIFGASLILATVLSSKTIKASEGSYELKNQVGTDARCIAATVLMENREFKVLFSCRNLDYPGGDQISYYIAWATPVDGSNAIKLGDLGYGKAEFQANRDFNSLFVTREFDKFAGSPSTNVVMKADVIRSTFLNQNQPQNSQPKEAQAQTPSPIQTPSPTKAPLSSITNIFKAVSVFAIIGLVGLIGLVFFLTRPRA